MVLFILCCCFSGSTTFSGVNDFDYPDIFGIESHQHAETPGNLLSSVKRVPIPEELFEQFDRILIWQSYYLYSDHICSFVAICLLGLAIFESNMNLTLKVGNHFENLFS